MITGRTPYLSRNRRARPWLALLAIMLLVVLIAVPRQAAVAAPAPAGDAPAASSGLYLPVLYASGQPAPAASSDELIDRAVTEGEIDSETGLVYKVYAAFGDARLPAKYRGDDSRPHEAPWLRQAAGQWPQLAKATRDILAPFIQPPVYLQSWFGQRQTQGGSAPQLAPGEVPTPLPGGAWNSLAVAAGKARIWWNTDVPGSTQAVAQSVADTLGGRVWPMLTTYMNRLPLDDAGPHVFVDLNGDEQVWGDGQDGAVDVYIIPGIGHGGAMTVGYPPGCTNIPAFMIVDPGMGNFEAAMAHEFMHVLQFAYKSLGTCADLGWVSEGSAHWAIDYVYSSNNFEHEALGLLQVPYERVSLGYGYDSWVFFWQLDRTLGLSDAVRKVWEQTEQFADPFAAVNAAIPGGWEANWPQVALHDLNRAPVDELKRMDLLAEPGALRHDEVMALGGAQSKTFTLNAVQYAPSAKFYRFTFPDPNVRTVAFTNPYTGDKYKTVHVQALARLQGKTSWEPVIDWSGKTGGAFCRDLQTERVEELYIVISDHEWQGQGHLYMHDPAPYIEVTNIACRGWEGEVTYKSWYIDEIEPGVVLSEINQDFWTGTTFLHAPRPDWLTGPGSALYFFADPSTEVSINDWGWWLDGHDPPIKCTYLVDDVAPVLTDRNHLIILADQTRAYGAEGEIAVVDLPGTDSCDGDITVHYDHPNWWLTGDGSNGAELVVSQDGTHITGKWERYRNPTSWASFEWSFTALPPE